MIDLISITLGVTAGVIQLVGYYAYMRYTKETNVGSWGIWAVGAIFDVASYALMTEDWVTSFLPATCALACMWTVGFLVIKRRFGEKGPDGLDWAFFWLDNLITAVWYVFRSATLANLLYQGSTALSFIPMLRDMAKGKHTEHWLPWTIWTIAYSLHFASVALRFDKWEELAFPIVHVAVHVAVLALLLYKKLGSAR